MAASAGDEEVTCVRKRSSAYASALRNSVFATARHALRSTWPSVAAKATNFFCRSTKAAKERPEEGEEE
eukprot:1206407-Pleurochrysis_carterae.AAC.2